MKKYTYRFRSIMVKQVEKVIPNTVFSKMVLEMDDTSIEAHTMELTSKEILRDTAWITNFLLSLMLVSAVSALLFAGFYAGFGRTMEPSSWTVAKTVFASVDMVIFIILWIFLSIRVSVDHKKRIHVEQKRGKGNWRIVDEQDWEKFHRLLMVAKNQRESEKVVK